MNNQEPTEKGNIPEFINLEEYNNLLRELDNLGENLFSVSELSVKFQLPEIVMETIKLISNLFYRTPVKNYLRHCILSNVLADFDRLLRHHACYEKLFDLIKNLDDGRD